MDGIGIAGSPAPELRVPVWLANVDDPAGLRLADVSEPLIYLFGFQAWCQGCHSHGFPELRSLRDGLDELGHGAKTRFIAVQTVFEDHAENTPERAVETMQQHDLADLPLGHDAGHPPTIMEDYRTGGTPWTILIGPNRQVLFNGFHLDVDRAVPVLADLLALD